jgi:hypothetical protein
VTYASNTNIDRKALAAAKSAETCFVTAGIYTAKDVAIAEGKTCINKAGKAAVKAMLRPATSSLTPGSKVIVQQISSVLEVSKMIGIPAFQALEEFVSPAS